VRPRPAAPRCYRLATLEERFYASQVAVSCKSIGANPQWWVWAAGVLHRSIAIQHRHLDVHQEEVVMSRNELGPGETLIQMITTADLRSELEGLRQLGLRISGNQRVVPTCWRSLAAPPPRSEATTSTRHLRFKAVRDRRQRQPQDQLGLVQPKRQNLLALGRCPPSRIWQSANMTSKGRPVRIALSSASVISRTVAASTIPALYWPSVRDQPVAEARIGHQRSQASEIALYRVERSTSCAVAVASDKEQAVADSQRHMNTKQHSR
jgi:hypothetical protein